MTDKEYADLCAEGGTVQRLDTYDELRKELGEAKSEVARLQSILLDSPEAEKHTLVQRLETANRVADEYEAALAGMHRERQELLALLRELEWRACTGHDNYYCPVCGRLKLDEGHAPDCRLAKALKVVQEKPFYSSQSDGCKCWTEPGTTNCPTCS